MLEKCKSKLQWGTNSHQSEWPSLKCLQIIDAGEGVEKREASYTVGGVPILIGTATMENSMEVPLKPKYRVTIWSSNPTPRSISGENSNSKRYMHPSVHSSTIYNS